MTRNEADQGMQAIDECRKMLVRQIAAIKRKKSWQEPVKAAAIAENMMTLDKLKKLHEALGTEHNLRGY